MKNFFKKITSFLFATTIVFTTTFSTYAAKNDAVVNTVSDSLIKEISTLSKSNYGMVSSGYLRVNPNGNIEITDKYTKYVNNKIKEIGLNATVSSDGDTMNIVEKSPMLYARNTKNGVTKIKWRSLNSFDIYLDNNMCRKLMAGYSFAGLISIWFPDPAVSKIIASSLAVSAGLITYNNRGRGVIISGMLNFTPRISVRFYWIRSQ